ncbi:MAG: hypothetical protein SFW09_02735 [Hyphomicrobiaceae bacterium]|nr:hypothetical protein [Hyphomicrobiaceae bacterium]
MIETVLTIPGFTLWVALALVPPLVLLGLVARHIAPRTLAPIARYAILLGCGSSLVTVWVRYGLPRMTALIGG